jgi:hypothetical protein
MATAAAEPTITSIDSLFRLLTRFRDSHVYFLPEGWTEVELLQDLAAEDVLEMGSSRWEEFCLFLQYKVAWMTPG